MTKHTPGPWILVKAPRSRTWELSAQGWKQFANVYGNTDPELNRQGEANARLIAAAPDLLEALKAIRQAFQSGTAMFVAQDMAEAAIAKAEGR